MAALKILVIPGSLRTGSLNAKLAAAAAYEFVQADAEVTRISLGDFPLPIYDGDLQNKSGVPKNAINLKRMIGAHHGVLIVTPEYNSSVPPLVKNTIDWVTRGQDPHETRGQGDVLQDRLTARLCRRFAAGPSTRKRRQKGVCRSQAARHRQYRGPWRRERRGPRRDIPDRACLSTNHEGGSRGQRGVEFENARPHSADFLRTRRS